MNKADLRRWRWLVPLLGLVAFLVRFVPVMRGGGLYGLGNYDDGVYYSAAVGLAWGRLPYRDFLLLHPPGIVLALLPFAVLGRVVGDANGLAVARLFWMLLGAANSILVGRFLRPLGVVPAITGGLFYALFFPVIYVEHTPLLEGLSSTCLLAAMVLLGSPAVGGRASRRAVLLGGALLGVSTATKVWGVVLVLAVAGWQVVAQGPRRARTLVLGAALGATAVCLPFFLTAPATMWRLVVTDQLSRAATGATIRTRLSDLSGLRLVGQPPPPVALLLLVLGLAAAAAVLAATSAQGRLAVVLLVSVTLLLLSTPSWFLHYSSMIGAPAAATVGAALRPVMDWLTKQRRVLRPVAAVLLVLGFAVYSAPLARLTLLKPFPAHALASAVRTLPGCITTDDPMTLIQLDVLSRNLQRGCPAVSDLGGYSYDMPVYVKGNPVSRARNPRWQRYALSYLRNGSVTILIRFSKGVGFSASSATTVKRWPVVLRAGKFTIRRPRLDSRRPNWSRCSRRSRCRRLHPHRVDPADEVRRAAAGHPGRAAATRRR